MDEYKEYHIREAHTDNYDVFIVCLSFESILNYLEKISQEELIQKTKGNLLIDQLLTTGNGKNRFLLCEYDHGKILLDTAKNIIPEESYKEKTVKLLKKEEEILYNSILTDSEKEKIFKEEAF